MSSSPTSPRRSRFRQALRWSLRGVGVFLLVYVGFLLLGFVPNGSGRSADDADTVRIFIRSNEVHTDLVLPTVSQEVDWRELFPPHHFRGSVADSPNIVIGWGDEGFFVHTRTWNDFQLTTALDALLLPSEGVLHVEYVGQMTPSETIREVIVDRQQYESIVRFVIASVRATDAQGSAVLATDRSYHAYDRFYQATGRYHLFNTSNQWTGRCLAQAELTTGIWTPLPQQVTYWLEPVD